MPRSCGTSKGTRPHCLLLGALYDWAVPSHHTPKHGATMLTTIPGARPMIDNSGRRINNTMSCRRHVVMMMTSSFTCVSVVMVIESPLLISHVQFEWLLQRRGMG